MLTYPKALEILLAHAPLLPLECIRIEDAAGRILRQIIFADRDFPPFDRVMMDGYALRIDDLKTARDFHVVASAPAGAPQISLPETFGVCVEVMTGAPLPCNADCIVPVEFTDSTGKGIRILPGFEAVKHRHVHWAGSDAKAGAPLVMPGTQLGSREIGVAASCGAVWLEVSRLPSIAIVATGDELVPVDHLPAPHQIRQSNAHAISASLKRAGYPVISSECIRDHCETSTNRIQNLLKRFDWIIITGAVSMGARDFVPDALENLGCRKLFHGVAQRPGKPAGCWLGPTGQMIIALPGNPVSAITGLHAFVLPALAVSSEWKHANARIVTMHGPVPSLPELTLHLPVNLDARGHATPAPTRNSGDFISLLHSDGFITIPPHDESVAAYQFIPWI